MVLTDVNCFVEINDIFSNFWIISNRCQGRLFSIENEFFVNFKLLDH